MRRRIWSAAVASIILLVGARAADDVSGIYSIGEVQGWDGASLNLVTTPDRVLVYFSGGFPYGQTHNVCDCLAQGKPDGAGKFTFSSEEAGFDGTVTVNADSVVMEVSKSECCGAGGPGFPKFPVAGRAPLRQCTVKSEKAVFHTIDNEPTKAYVVKGDHVEVSESEPTWDTALARYAGKKPTIGRMKLEDLDCPKASKP